MTSLLRILHHCIRPSHRHHANGIRAALAIALPLTLALNLPSYVDNPPRLVRDINLATEGSDPSEFTAVGDVGYFAAAVVGSGRELWRSDGTAAGRMLVSDIAPGLLSSSPSQLTVAGLNLFFAADQLHGQELWAVSIAGNTVYVPSVRK